jgi:BolA protein
LSDRLEKIRSQLVATFSPLECQLADESHLHAGHPGAASGGGHYRLHLISARFEGLNRVARHRLVYDCLRDMMHADIHALAINALAPSEIQKKQDVAD